MVFACPNSLRSEANTRKERSDQRRNSAFECWLPPAPTEGRQGASSSVFFQMRVHTGAFQVCHRTVHLEIMRSDYEHAAEILQRTRETVCYIHRCQMVDGDVVSEPGFLPHCFQMFPCMPCKRKTNPEVLKPKQAQQHCSQMFSVPKILNQRQKH